MMAQDSNDPTGVSHDGTGNKETVQRARQRKANAALQLKMSGATWDEIAMALGYPTARAAMVATEGALERQMLNSKDREKLRGLAGARLERLLRGMWSKAIDPDHPEHLIAATKARETIAQYAKLMGLDSPTEVVVHNPTMNEIEQWVANVISHKIPVVEEFDIIEGTVISDDDDPDGGVPALVG